MLKSCPYCGRIHARTFDCGKRPTRGKKRGSETDRFHSSSRWTETSRAIRARDKFLCQGALHNLDGQGVRYVTDDLSVHHIDSLEEDWDKRLDRDNLITLSRELHEAAEAGKISKAALREIAIKNNST